MTSIAQTFKGILAFLLLAMVAIGIPAQAGTPPTENGVTTIVLDEYNGYFAARDTIMGLKAGTYDFVVTNKTDKLVGFWLQDGKTHAELDKFGLEPGKSRTTRVEISGNGFRYRCPINPTPWYDVSVEG